MVRNVHVSFDEVRHVLRQGLPLKKYKTIKCA